jgi:flagellar M-ring protein FliF
MAGSNQIAVVPQGPNMAQMLDRMKHFWASRTTRQKIYLGVGLAVTLAALAALGQMISAPDYKTLMTGLEPADTQTIAAQLAAKKIPYVVAPDGTSVSVPADQLDVARVEMASHDAPHSGRIGYEIFDKVSWGQTEFDEKVNYQRALEGELERTIQTMSSVKSARVHLVMASSSVFIDRERGAKASVTLRLKRGTLSREQLEAISRLVSGAVDELKPSDINIVDADSNRSLGIATGSEAESDSMERQLSARLIATLSPIVGVDHIHSSVNVEYETGSSEENQEKYDPAVSTPLNMQRSEEHTSDGTAAGGVPGTSTNVPSATPAAAGAAAAAAAAGQTSKTESATYGVNKTTRHTVEPAGRIRRLTAAVLIDDVIERKQEKGKWVETHHKRSPEDMKLIGDLAQAAIGFNSTRGDVVSIQNLAFDRGDPIEDVPLNAIGKFQKNLSPYATPLRYAGLLVLFALVYLLMIRPVQKKALAAPPELPAEAPMLPGGDGVHAIATPESDVILGLRAAALKKQLSEFVQAEPESSTTIVRAWLREAK